MSKQKIGWKKVPEVEDYNSALTFLSLILPAARCEELLQGLRAESNVDRAAKDLLRASNLPLLPRDDPHLEGDLKTIHKGKSLAPVLRVRGDVAQGCSTLSTECH